MPPRPPSPTRRPVTPTASPRKKPPVMEDPIYAPSPRRHPPIDLNSSQCSVDRSTGQRVVKRAFFVDVVVERDAGGQVGAETQALLETFGRPITPSDLRSKLHRRNTSASASTSRSRPGTPSKDRDGSSKPNKAKLQQLVNELKETEERYLRRITVLKQSYADPLRKFAKRPETLIIPLYDAKALFANIDALVIAAQRFAADLDDVDVSGRVDGRGIGDICLKHLKDLGTFDCYRAYYDKQDESQRSFTNMIKRQSFETFIESVKYQTSGIGNIGLRELLAEPVQRIPRYTLLWQSMLDCMTVGDEQREKLEEAIGLASDIALCETDERTRRATIMYCLDRTVEGFPVNLMSNSRDFVDCIDVDDIPVDWRDRPNSLTSVNSDPAISDVYGSTAPSSPSRNGEGNNSGVLNATLFLFDDKLVIAKRQSPGISGCKVTGLDNVDKLVKGGGGLPGLMQQGAGLRRDKLSFRGMVDILDIMVADTGEGDFQLFMDKPPLDQSERWAGRHFRSLSTVQPPLPRGMDTIAARTEKERFIKNLWHSQALIKAKALSTIIKRPEAAGCPGTISTNLGEEKLIHVHGSRDERVVPYACLWDKSAWRMDPRKAKIALQIDESGAAETIPFSTLGGPVMIIRVQPLPGAICRWQVITKDREDVPNEEELIHSDQVNERIKQITAAAHLYHFSQPMKSPATTPTSFRHRPSMINLDSISRNLFGTGSISSRGHSMTSSQRSKSVVSRSSTLDTSRYSVQSRSTTATSVDSEMHPTSPEKTVTTHVRQATSVALSMVDEESGDSSDDPASGPARLIEHAALEMDLDSRLELARTNSASAAKGLSASVSDHHRDRYDDYADDSVIHHSRTLVVRNRTPSPDLPPVAPESMAITSPQISPVRPLDLTRRKSQPPLSPTPRKAYGSLSLGPSALPSGSDHASPRSVPRGNFPDRAGSPSMARPLGGSSHTRMQIVESSSSSSLSGLDATSRHDGRRVSSGAHKRMRSQEDLAPRKKSIDRSPLEPRSLTEQIPVPESRTPRKPQDKANPVRKASGMTASSAHTVVPMQVDQPSLGLHGRDDRTLYKTAISAKEHITVAMRTARSMQGEMKDLTSHMGTDLALKERISRVGEAPLSMSRSPPSRQLSVRAHGSPVKASSTGMTPSTPSRQVRRTSRTELDLNYMEEWSRSISALVDQLALDLEHARGLQQTIVTGAANADEIQKNATIDREASAGRLNRANNKLELAQTQLTDLKAELETVYDAFNTELDCLFNDANLPPEDAYIALRTQLQETKAERNQLRLENLKLRTELQEANLRKEEWAKLLKTHGVLA